MNKLGKDELSLIIIKLNFKDVLALRLTCKYIYDCICSYNKFWFLKWFKNFSMENMKDIEAEDDGKDNNFMKLITQKQHLYGRLNFDEKNINELLAIDIHLSCFLSPDQRINIIGLLIDNVFKHRLHENYPKWKSEWRAIYKNILRKYGEPKTKTKRNYKFSYCNAQYFMTIYPENKCLHLCHYIDDEWYEQSHINIINDNLVDLYDINLNYCEKYFKLINKINN